jgi:hypothetical protein
MGSEMQPGVMRAQKREIQTSPSCKKNLIFSVKKLLSVVFIWNWKSFLQLFSKLILKIVISFMCCGYVNVFYPLLDWTQTW